MVWIAVGYAFMQFHNLFVFMELTLSSSAARCFPLAFLSNRVSFFWAAATPLVFVFKSIFLFVDTCFYLLGTIRLVVGKVKDVIFGNNSIHTGNVVCYCLCCLVQLQVVKDAPICA